MLRTARQPQRANPKRKEARTRIKKAPKNSHKKKIGSLPNSPLSTSLMTGFYLSSGITPNFKWPPPMRANPHNQSLRCDYHRGHDHETNRCQSLKFLVEKLIRAGHLIRYIREPTYGIETAPQPTEQLLVLITHLNPGLPATSYWEARPMTNTVQMTEKKNAPCSLS